MHFARFTSTFVRDLKFLEIKEGGPILQNSELFGRPICILISKLLRTHIFRHSLDFNPFCMIQKYFSQSLEISTN